MSESDRKHRGERGEEGRCGTAGEFQLETFTLSEENRKVRGRRGKFTNGVSTNIHSGGVCMYLDRSARAFRRKDNKLSAPLSNRSRGQQKKQRTKLAAAFTRRALYSVKARCERGKKLH